MNRILGPAFTNIKDIKDLGNTSFYNENEGTEPQTFIPGQGSGWVGEGVDWGLLIIAFQMRYVFQSISSFGVARQRHICIWLWSF